MGLGLKDGDSKLEGGVFIEPVGKPLSVSFDHSLQDLVKFAETYGVDLELHGVGDKMEAQITTLVVIKK